MGVSALTAINTFLNDGKNIGHIPRFSNGMRTGPESSTERPARKKQKRGRSEDHPRLSLEGNFPEIP
jgi:hypothetical protein